MGTQIFTHVLVWYYTLVDLRIFWIVPKFKRVNVFMNTHLRGILVGRTGFAQKEEQKRVRIS